MVTAAVLGLQQLKQHLSPCSQNLCSDYGIIPWRIISAHQEEHIQSTHLFSGIVVRHLICVHHLHKHIGNTKRRDKYLFQRERFGFSSQNDRVLINCAQKKDVSQCSIWVAKMEGACPTTCSYCFRFRVRWLLENHSIPQKFAAYMAARWKGESTN